MDLLPFLIAYLFLYFLLGGLAIISVIYIDKYYYNTRVNRKEILKHRYDYKKDMELSKNIFYYNGDSFVFSNINIYKKILSIVLIIQLILLIISIIITKTFVLQIKIFAIVITLYVILRIYYLKIENIELSPSTLIKTENRLIILKPKAINSYNNNITRLYITSDVLKGKAKDINDIALIIMVIAYLFGKVRYDKKDIDLINNEEEVLKIINNNEESKLIIKVYDDIKLIKERNNYYLYNVNIMKKDGKIHNRNIKVYKIYKDF